MDGVTVVAPEISDPVVRQEGGQGWGGGADKTSSTTHCGEKHLTRVVLQSLLGTAVPRTRHLL